MPDLASRPKINYVEAFKHAATYVSAIAAFEKCSEQKLRHRFRTAFAVAVMTQQVDDWFGEKR